MRVGNNPNKNKPAAAKLERVVLQVITYLPNQTGYHAKRLEVVKTCISSMVKGVQMPYSLIITDNGSIPELLEWIRDEIRPTMLISSQNLGKNAQRKLIAQMLPPESVLCYSDDDMYFYNNWLAPQLQLLQNYPNVSCVSGYPVRTSFRWGNKNTIEWARQNALLEFGRFLPEQWERDFAVSVGRDEDEHIIGTRNDTDIRIVHNGVVAYATSHHCQQIGYAGRLAQVLEFDGKMIGEERTFDERLDKLGLRLATTKRLARHIGNVIDDKLRKEIGE